MITDTDISLDALDVRVPCAVPWASMEGDERVRFCGACRLHVVNLSVLTRDEATDLLRARGERFCGRFYRRADGTVVTSDCVPIAARLRRRAQLVAGALAAFFGLGSATLAAGVARSGGLDRAATWEKAPLEQLGEVLPVEWVPQDPGQWVVGDICLPAPGSGPQGGDEGASVGEAGGTGARDSGGVAR